MTKKWLCCVKSDKILLNTKSMKNKLPVLNSFLWKLNVPYNNNKKKSEEDITAKREKDNLNLRLKQLAVVSGVCFFNKDFIFATLVPKCRHTNQLFKQLFTLLNLCLLSGRIPKEGMVVD
jgi:hypothetical protein